MLFQKEDWLSGLIQWDTKNCRLYLMLGIRNVFGGNSPFSNRGQSVSCRGGCSILTHVHLRECHNLRIEVLLLQLWWSVVEIRQCEIDQFKTIVLSHW